METEYFLLVFSAMFGALLTALLLKIMIPMLKRLKVGQAILRDGPVWHMKKEGTPTMGGVAFGAVIPVIFILVVRFLSDTDALGDERLYNGAVCALTYAILCGLIGAADDLCKLRRRENKGLTALQKYVALLAVTVAFLFTMNRLCGLSTALYIPFIQVEVELGVFYWVFATVLLTGTVNAVNLTDGVDGLCGSVSAAVLLFFFCASLYMESVPLSLLSALGFGGCMGFLVFNLHPAKVFMGDTGSLFLGALICGLAFAIGSPIVVFIAGAIYMLEAFSVIVQVAVFKITKKRVFKMAPFHHHLEKSGWSENRIVAVFTASTVVLCALYVALELF